MAFDKLDQLRTSDELRSRADEVQAELTEMNVRSEGRPFTEEDREIFAALKEERDEAIKRAEELEARERIVASYSEREENREKLSFNTHRPGSSAAKNIYDLADVPFEPTARNEEMKDRAKRAADAARLDAGSQDRIEGLLERDATGSLAQRILVTDSPAYKRAFQKYLVQKPLTSEEARALSTATNYAVPAFVDPTVVLTSAGVNNPIRQMARVITIVGNTWTGVASTGITASFSAESTEASDNSPSLTQPAANVEKAQMFIQYPIEVGDDWGALESEMAVMFADAKDTLESSKYLKGTGHSNSQPEGLLVGATGTVPTASSSVMAVADLYSLVEALSPRWRRRAQFAGALAAYNKIRQFDSSGGGELVGPARERSAGPTARLWGLRVERLRQHHHGAW